MVVVKYSETYDLCTTKGKVGLLAVHTPSSTRIDSLWRGLRLNHRFIRVLGCDVHLACASMLPADPLQVGVGANNIAPQDLFNPILFKAVTNESLDTVVARMYQAQAPGYDGTSIDWASGAFDIPNPDDAEENLFTEGMYENLYYALLNSPGWKKAMPQAGFDMMKLRPLVHEVVNTFGNELMVQSSSSVNTVAGNNMSANVDNEVSLVSANVSKPYSTFRGRAKPMPRMPTSNSMVVNGTGGVNFTAPGDLVIPQTYVMCAVLPPAKLHQLFFRFRVVWYIEYSGVMPLTERGNLSNILQAGTRVYARSYTFGGSSGSKSDYVPDDEEIRTGSSVDTINMDVNQVI